jgi:hypothetical protein
MPQLVKVPRKVADELNIGVWFLAVSFNLLVDLFAFIVVICELHLR